MIQANILSAKPFYCTENGQLFNENRQLIIGTYNKQSDIHTLSYINTNNVEKKITLTRLIYQTFKPNISIENCTIIRRNKKDVFRYSINNLIRIDNKDLPKKNNIARQQPFSITDRTFYLDFKPDAVKELIENIKIHSLTHVAKIYNVSATSISRAKKKLIA